MISSDRRSQFLKKKDWGSEFGSNGLKSGSKLCFLPFSQVGSLVFLEIAYNDSLQQCPISSRGKIHKRRKKNCDPNLSKGSKLGPELGFLPFSKVWFISFH